MFTFSVRVMINQMIKGKDIWNFKQKTLQKHTVQMSY